MIGPRYDTFRCEWRAGAASITLMVWPTELRSTSLKNTGHERDPRLVTACHGRSRHGEALIVCSDQLYVVPARELLGFRVSRLIPARGGGGSTLEALCRARAGSGPVKHLTVARANETYDLDRTGPAFAKTFGRYSELAVPYPDE